MRISDWSSDVGSSDLPFTCDARIFTSSSKTLSIPFAATDWERARNATTDSEWACWKSWNFMVTSVRLAKACDDELTNCLTFYEVAIMGRKILALIVVRSEEHTSELQSLMRISYAVFCLKKKKSYEE